MTDTRQAITAVRTILSNFLKQLNKLPDDQLQKVLEGRAKFVGFETKRTSQPTKTTTPVFSDATKAEWKEKLYACKTRDEGKSYIAGLRILKKKRRQPLTKDEIMEFAEFLDCGALSKSLNKESLIKALVEHTLGHELDKKSYLPR